MTRRLAWAAWNYHVRPGGGPVALTYNMNVLQRLEAPQPFLVTLNHTDAIDPDRIIRRVTYHHPLYTPASVAAQSRHREIDGARATYYCARGCATVSTRTESPARSPPSATSVTTMHSALYIGRLIHRRRRPVPHAFDYALCYAWLDLAELDEVFRGRWLWPTRRPALAWLRRADYLGDPSVPLDTAVRDRV